MEYYLKSWDGVVQGNRSYSSGKNGLGMKNSLDLESDGGKVGCNESCADSLPIHCIIQTFSSLEDLKAVRCRHCGGKTDPSDCFWECECDRNEFTGCILVPEDTSMNDLLRTALLKLGYPPSASPFATGSILIRNWNPLPLEVICPDMNKTVGHILGDITAVATLRIHIFNPKVTAAQKIKDGLLFFLVNANHAFLRETRCPFDVATLSNFCDHSLPLKMQFLQEPSDDMRRKFESWLEDLQEVEKAGAGRKKRAGDPLSRISKSERWSCQYSGCENRVTSPAMESSVREGSGQRKDTVKISDKEASTRDAERAKPFATPKTRVRTSFDPEFELPKLQKWFSINPHPSRQQIFEYVGELNALESRKGRKQLDVNNVVYWFKNARAAQKRTECRMFLSTSAAETSRCNVLRIPSGKNCSAVSDDQRSVSDDEASVTSESGDDFQKEKTRCLQVVGKWNSNGQGEAVLEMQIPTGNDFSQHGKKDKTTEGDEASKNFPTYLHDGDRAKESSASEKRDFRISEKASPRTESHTVLSLEGNAAAVKMSEAAADKIEEKICEENGKADIPPPQGHRLSGFISFQENAAVEDNDFLSRYKSGFSVPSSPMLNPSFVCVSQFVGAKAPGLPLSSEERRKRNRTFIDPVTEVPRLEQWFRLSTHPSHNLIARYTEELNNMPYRRKFSKLEAKNVQFWFKNRRAKNKRLNHLETSNN